ncbi:fibronectin type III domain-containing protein [Candidatus Riflebacteria bacterium]
MTGWRQFIKNPSPSLLWLFLFAGFCLLYLGCAAQPLADVPDDPPNITGSISGMVTHKVTYEALSNVIITVSASGISTTTDTNGAFTIENLQKGGHELTFSKSGFEEISQEFLVAAGSNTDGSIALRQIPHISNVVVKNITSESAEISWETPFTVASGYIQYEATGAPLNGFSSSTEASTTHSVVLYPLASGTLYQYQILAFDSLNESNFNSSQIMNLTTGDGTPPRMNNISVNTTSNEATISWSVDRNSYPRVYYGTSADDVYDGNNIVGSAPASLSLYTQDQKVTLKNLKENTDYYYLAESIDTFGESSLGISSQNNISLFNTAALTAVELKPVDQITDTTARIVWEIDQNTDTNVSFSHYRIDGFTSMPTNTTATSSVIIAILPDKTTRNHTIADLSPNTEYFFKVSVVDKGNNLKESNFQSFRSAADSIYFDPQLMANPIDGPIIDACIVQGDSDGINADGFLLGKMGKIARLLNHKTGEWVNVNSPTDSELTAIDGVKDNFIAVGKKVILRWDGNSWTRVIDYDFADYLEGSTRYYVDNVYSDVSYASNTKNFLVSANKSVYRYSSSSGQFETYISGGKTYKTRVRFGLALEDANASHTLTAVSTYSGQDSGVVVGTKGLIASFPYSNGLNYNSIDFHATSAEKTTAASTTNNLRDIAMIDHNNGWIVGDAGTILHLNGALPWDTAQKDSEITGAVLKVTAVSKTKAYAVTMDRKLLAYDGTVSPLWKVIARFDDSLSSVYFEPVVKNGYNLGIVTSSAGHIFFRAH